MEIQNANPTILSVSDLPTRRQLRKGRDASQWLADDLLVWNGSDDSASALSDPEADDSGDPIDEQEIYDLIATISDPEHPLTLGQLAVVNLPDIRLDPPPIPGMGPNLDTLTTVTVELTPTVNHCSLATVIGLAVRVRLESSLPPNYRLDIRIKDGSHAQGDQVDKQLADKERVAAALENDTLKRTLDAMMETCVNVYSGDDSSA